MAGIDWLIVVVVHGWSWPQDRNSPSWLVNLPPQSPGGLVKATLIGHWWGNALPSLEQYVENMAVMFITRKLAKRLIVDWWYVVYRIFLLISRWRKCLYAWYVSRNYKIIGHALWSKQQRLPESSILLKMIRAYWSKRRIATTSSFQN